MTTREWAPWPVDIRVRTWPVFPGDVRDVRKWTSYVKAFESGRIASCECILHVVTFGHVTKMAVTSLDPPYLKPHATRKSDGFIFYRTGVMGEQGLHCWNRNFRPHLHFRPYCDVPFFWYFVNYWCSVCWICRWIRLRIMASRHFVP